jgi:hypothetical protein
VATIIKYGYPVGLCLLFFSFLIYLFSYLTLWIDQNISILSFSLALILSYGLLRYLNKHSDENQNYHPFSTLLISILVLLFSVILSGIFYDYSSDGQSYNQSAILHLKDGWNFLTTDIPLNFHHAIYLNGYCKGPWVLATSIYELTNDLESGKAFNFVFALIVGLISIKSLQQLGFKKNWLILSIALIFAFDPVNLNTLFSFTVDGQVSSFSKLLLLGIVIFYFNPKIDGLLILGITIIYGLNIKFTFIPFFAFFAIACVLFFVKFNTHKNLKYYLSVLSISTLLGIGLFGFNPYISNTLNHQSPFYPVYSNTNEIIINKSLADTYLPTNFKGDNNLVKLVKSTFAKTSFSKSFNKEVSYKFPFSFSIQELTTYAGTGVMIGGHGVLFSGILLLLFFVVFLFIINKKAGSVFWKMVFISIIIAGSVIINPLSWWARFAPQFWLIPFIWSLYFIRNTKGRFQVFGKLLFFLIALNSFLMTGYFAYNVHLTIYNHRLFEELKNSSKELYFDFGIHESFEAKLIKQDIPFKIYSPLDIYTDCKDIKGTTAKYCIK